MNKTLGILLTSENHWDGVLQLTLAAERQGCHVKILLSGKGVLMIKDPRFHTLLKRAAIALCPESCRAQGLKGDDYNLALDRMVPYGHHADILMDSDRCLVF